MNKPKYTKAQRSLRLSLLAGALALSACSTPNLFKRPAAPIAPLWPASAQASEAAPAGDLLPWRTYFTDPALQTLIAQALENNRDLRVAALNITQARAQLGLRSADQLPTLNAAFGMSRAPNSSGNMATSFTGGLLVSSYELDFFGRVASLKEQALAQYLASEEARRTAQISLIATVAQAWMGLGADARLLRLAQETLASREASLQLVALRLEHGASSELDVRLAQSLVQGARVSLAQLQRQRALDENALVLLLGQPLTPAQAALVGADAPAVNLPVLPAGLPSELLTRRADIRQAEQQLAAANANIGAARAAFFPRIALTASAGSASSALDGLFKDGSWSYTFVPQLLLPLFDGGRNEANLAAAKAGFDLAVAQYEKAIQTAFREVADALAARASWERQLQAQTALAQADAERLALTRLRLDNGAASQLDWLDAQRTAFASQQALIAAQLALLQTQVTLYKVLGGGAEGP
ncbi:MAG: efflux transporter outer membrane subunit [Rhodoferax sp.]|nr:efflux transporter outer membrane subunit [Rhodoferax sp.]